MDHDSALAAQWALCQLADNPTQFNGSGFSAMYQQAANARYGHDGELPLLDVPF